MSELNDSRPKFLSSSAVFTVLLVVMLLSAAFVPGLPLLAAIVSLFTPLRRQPWKQVTLWSLAVLISLAQLIPFIPPTAGSS